MIRDARAAVVETETEDAREQDDALTNFSLWVDFDETGIDMPALVETGDSVVLQGGDAVYRAYTTRYDRELRPAAQIRAALLRSIATGSTPGSPRSNQRHAASPRAARRSSCRRPTAGRSVRSRAASTAAGSRNSSARRPNGGCFGSNACGRMPTARSRS